MPDNFVQSEISLAFQFPTAKTIGYGSKAEVFEKDHMLYIQFFEPPSSYARGDLLSHGFVHQPSISPLVWANETSAKACFYAGHIAW